jgi:uncharacterized protein (DUF952 family)
MNAIYHITTRSAWAMALPQGQYCHPSLQAEGFIHCARRDQTIGVANSLFRSRDDLIVLEINPEKLKASLRDDCTASGEVFPHVYGAINTAAIENLIELNPQSDGTFSWPEYDPIVTNPSVYAAAAGTEGLFPSVLV